MNISVSRAAAKNAQPVKLLDQSAMFSVPQNIAEDAASASLKLQNLKSFYQTQGDLLAAIKAGDDIDLNKLTPDQQLFYDILKELVEIDTSVAANNSTSSGEAVGTLKAARAMAMRLRAAGFDENDIQIIQPLPDTAPNDANLIVRLHGKTNNGSKALLLMGHMDVIPAKKEEWKTDPFKLTVAQGKYGPEFRGRGVNDDKASIAAYLATLIKFKKESIVPDQDILIMATTGEEQGGGNGVPWLVKNRPELFKDIEFGINENGGEQLKDGKPSGITAQLAEKSFQTFELKAEGDATHSAYPKPKDTSSINRLTKALDAVANMEFPIELNEATRGFFAGLLSKESDPNLKKAITDLLAGVTDIKKLAAIAARPEYIALLRDTLVTCIVRAGEAPNAVPKNAEATLNGRLLPGHTIEDMKQKIINAINDSNISVTLGKFSSGTSPASPFVPRAKMAIEKIVADMWPGVPVIPIMSAGGSDARFIRKLDIPVVGSMGLFLTDEGNAHSPDENGGVKEVFDSYTYMYRLIKELTAPNTSNK